MELYGSDARSLRAEDFSTDQVERWCNAAPGRPAYEAKRDAPVSTWVAVYTNPKREHDVANELKRRTFVTYVPAMTVTKRRRDVLRPLLPRHVFVGFREGLNFLDLDETPGLEGVVRMGAAPAHVNPDVLTLLRDREASGDFDFSAYKLARQAECARQAERLKTLADLEAGGIAVIQAGPYLSFEGRFDRALDDERVSILLKLFGREFPIPIALDHIKIRMLRR